MQQQELLETPEVVWTVTVEGHAMPGGSKKGFVDPRTERVVVVEDSKNKPWKRAVASEGKRVRLDAPILEGALAVVCTFARPRPKSHYGVRGLLPSAPAFPVTRPDVLKLMRAVEDALTGVLWVDDSQIVDEHLVKRWAALGEPERMLLTVTALEGR
jgi:Holliday junction resolvase RusA-like endonuclease